MRAGPARRSAGPFALAGVWVMQWAGGVVALAAVFVAWLTRGRPVIQGDVTRIIARVPFTDGASRDVYEDDDGRQ